jgi:hypothetical protein
MIKATFYVAPVFNFLENRIFSSEYFTNGLKNYAFMFIELRNQLAAQGIDLATQDIHPPENSKIVIAFDEVAFFQTYQRRPGQLLYLFLNEPANYWPELWQRNNHSVFDRVFTYDYNLADGKKYIHHYFAIDLDNYPPVEEVTEEDFKRRKLLVLVAGMFQLTPPKSGSSSLLYARYRTMRWFGKHLPQQFDFFSRGIDPTLFESFRGLGVLRRVLPTVLTNRLVATIAARRRREVDAICQGPVPPLEKLTTLKKYKFVVSYENSRLAGYISEKLFDCLFSGSVPVYWGEPNIQRFVPAACYIDRQVFADDAALADFLSRMTYVEYSKYIAAIRAFVGGIEYEKFGSEPNAKRVSDVLLADLADPTRLANLS